MRPRAFLVCAALALMVAGMALPARAASIEKTFTFEVGKWYDLDVSEGPATVHRIRIAEQTGGITKSSIFRPTGSEFLRTVQMQIEYSNAATKDWEAKFEVVWVDNDDKVIDGYRGTEDMDKKQNHDLMTVTLSTLKYGIDVGKKLRVKIDFGP
jgi:hypothetical protein